MTAPIGNGAEIVAAAVADYEQGQREPLLRLIEAGTPEVLGDDKARALIVEALRGPGRPTESRRRAERVRLLTFLHMLTGYGYSVRKGDGPSAVEIAAQRFSWATSTVDDIWRRHNGGYLWLRAREEGAARRKLDASKRRSDTCAAVQYLHERCAHDIYVDGMEAAREAAAFGELRQAHRTRTPRLHSE